MNSIGVAIFGGVGFFFGFIFCPLNFFTFLKFEVGLYFPVHYELLEHTLSCLCGIRLRIYIYLVYLFQVRVELKLVLTEFARNFILLEVCM